MHRKVLSVKRIISVFLAVVLLFSVAAPVFAASVAVAVPESSASCWQNAVRSVKAFFDRVETFFKKLLGNKPLDVPAVAPQTIAAPDDSTEMHLVWHDEFDGTSLDGTKW
ncbi:MAG TPA: hypothetical protein DDY98_01070, partial [Ruminococcaceae bacterium]|nr:hypothetical protein [Oscillospiraceae bacterium]